MYKPALNHILVLLLPLMLLACVRSRHGELFDDIECRIEADPRAAAAYADSLASDSALLRDMTDYDRARFGLLRIKSADKAYIRHTSDSLLLTVTEYYERHPKAEGYPEALYYAGRVYSDLGDSPTALRYYQRAIEALTPVKEDKKDLMTCVLSQTGRLLDELQLRNEAIEYLKSSIQLEKETGDTVGLMYDYDLLGLMYCQLKDNREAVRCYNEANSYATRCNPGYALKIQSNIAKNYLDLDDITKAEDIISGLIDKIDEKRKPAVLVTASEVYYRSEKFDTAYLYAQNLINTKGSNNLRIGYHIMFKPEIIGKIPRDSLEKYIMDYIEENKAYLDRNANERATIQNAMYNYHLHDEEKLKALKAQKVREWLIAAVVVLLLLSILTAVIIRNRQQKQIIKLQTLLAKLDNVKALYIYNNMGEERPYPSSPTEINAKTLRNELQKRILQDYEERKDYIPQLSTIISESKVYQELRLLVLRATPIPMQSSIWEDLKRVILSASPSFLLMLEGLSSENLGSSLIETAMLIKCRFSPIEIAALTGRSKSTISTRRKALRSKLFGNLNENLTSKDNLDYIIWLL